MMRRCSPLLDALLDLYKEVTARVDEAFDFQGSAEGWAGTLSPEASE